MLLLLKRFWKVPISRKLQMIDVFYSKIKHMLFLRFLYKKWNGGLILSPLFCSYETITIGKNTFIYPDSRIEGITYYANNKFTPNIIFEDNVSFGQRLTITAVGKIIIGENTLGSFDIMITDIDHSYLDIVNPVGDQELIYQETIIGKSCFIGAGVKILAGTILGNHCIVGCNSVVRGVFPDYCVIAGIPARVVKKYNFNTNEWEKITNS